MLVAVIGHGKSPEGRGWGHWIDACDCVVRMWDCHWQHPDDYGRRYDFGLFEAHPTLMPDFYKHRQRFPSLGWVASRLSKARVQLPEGTQLVDQQPWNDMARKMGGHSATGTIQFTRGTVATCWVLESLAVAGDSIVLVGFDNVHKGRTLSIEEGFSETYRKAPSSFSFRGYKADVRTYGNHDFGIEGPLLFAMARKRGVGIGFAQDIW